MKFLLQMGIKIIIEISQIPKYLISSKIYIATPSVLAILIYYIIVLVIFSILILRNKKKNNMSEKRILNLVALAKFRYRQISNKKKKIIFILLVTSFIFVSIIPKDLKINFIDVGQGDSTFIETPYKKTILIDGGGSRSEDFDVGKSILLPYILRKGYTKIDYVVISHFDQDHVGGIFEILEELKVNQVIISKQPEESDNYTKFLEIVRDRNIQVKVVKKGDIIKIEDNCYLKILWPTEKVISEKALNNNAIVLKFEYKDFSCLFTGDIEKVAEQELIKQYTNELHSDILKVAHHGSKTSSTEDFLKKVKPKIALIGVGADNAFGHPNEEVLQRIYKYTNKIYRTDICGEICIKFTKKSIINIKYFCGGNST